MSGYWKRVWEHLNTPTYQDDSVNEHFYDQRQVNQPESKKSFVYCPFCGYSGTPDELNCHLLNRHKP